MTAPRKKKEEALTVRGLGVSSGIAIGPPFILHTAAVVPLERTLAGEAEVRREVDRFHHALDVTREQLNHLSQEAKSKYGKEYSGILEAHFLILEDVEMMKRTLKLIQTNRVNAEAAFASVMDKFRAGFLKSANEYIRERATDVEDVKRRLLANLLGYHQSFVLAQPSIIVADTIRPSDVAGLERARILGFISESGSTLSHFAIVARSLNIPAIVGIANASGFVTDQDTLLLDGHTGEVIINPDARTVEKYTKKSASIRRAEAELESQAQLPCVTRDGTGVVLSANVELAEEVETALRNGAEGIGLYRTEYMLFSARELPDEQRQYDEYRKIAEKIHPHKLTMRTFDVGGDKIPLDILASKGYVHEENPFLGWRAIRIALECPEFFTPQIRAMLRLSAEFKIEIMLPMIISLDEVRRLKAMIDMAKQEMRREKTPFNEAVPVGIMIETPAAAILAETLAPEVDFFSIGTNDLVQYTLAADRGNPKVANLYSCFHPAVLQLLARTIGAANRHGIPVAMCGEMASNPNAIRLLLGMGLHEFSALPPRLPKIRKLIRGATMADNELLARKVLAMNDLKTIESTVVEETRRILGKED